MSDFKDQIDQRGHYAARVSLQEFANTVRQAAGETPTLVVDPSARKEMPMARGLLDYFPNALAETSHVSYRGSQQHNPGQEMHWARGKSTDHADCIMRHLVERGTIDSDGVRHSAKLVWRALALLQEELEAAGAPLSRGSRNPVPAIESEK